MAYETRYYKARLARGSDTVPAKVRYASRHSLWIRLEGEGAGRDGRRCDDLELDVGDQRVAAGPGVLLVDEENPDEYRYVPQRSIRDFEQLLFHSKHETLDSGVANLPLVLSYKANIRPEFSGFVADLTYDLNSYRAAYNQTDERIADEKPCVRATLQDGIAQTMGRRLSGYLDRVGDRIAELTGAYTAEQHGRHGFYFRKQLWDAIREAPIMRRTNTKPRGYIGDSRMMRMIYDNRYEGESTFGRILHHHAVGQAAAEAVRNRRGRMAQYFRRFRAEGGGSETGPIRVLSLACGAAVELHQMIRGPEEARGLELTLLDQDRSALLEAAGEIETLQDELGQEIVADYVNESVRTLLMRRDVREHWGPFEFIYSMGLFDYLTRPVATALLGKLYRILVPGGHMVIGNFSTYNPSAIYMAYWMDWPIIHRSKEAMLDLLRKSGGAEAAVETDESGIQQFLSIRKPRRGD